ncbi:hypothetical protein NDU88_002815 [Pleurodeles waltl]|uniref:Uncharacterized protein n=1 Tax=Pleurodeles waltl TaxID=8319 RepID=A0AAV7W0D9_PLEWA|nr:hypothetical protein NDU88_002815 [Pleurodeles waltl]
MGEGQNICPVAEGVSRAFYRRSLGSCGWLGECPAARRMLERARVNRLRAPDRACSLEEKHPDWRSPRR